MTSDPERNCILLKAFIEGLHAAGIAGGAKHFPGADPYEYRDSHFCTASYSQSLAYWEQTQMPQFQACIDAGVDSIMVGHKTFRAVDDTRVNGALLPCTLSYKVITELLKGRMGFEGVVLTDDVAMKALSAIYEPRKLYVELLRAGNDMILGPVTLDYIDVVEQAVLSGDLPESRIDDACRRVLTLKERYGLLEHKTLVPPTEEEREAVRENIRAVSRDVAERGMTITANRLHLVPLNREAVKKVKLVYIGYSDDCEKHLQHAVEEFARHGASCDYQVGFCPADNATLKDYDLIVYATFIGMHMPPGGRAFFGEKCLMMRHIMTTCVEKSVGVSFGDPDIYFNYFTAAPTFVNCYSHTPENAVAFVKGLYGEIPFGTYAPFPLNPITRDNNVY
jgi:beta-N-acetylhexosaminidase